MWTEEFHPKLGQVFHDCQLAIGGEDASRYTQYLAQVMSFVAQTVERCDELLHYIEEVESGSQDSIETGGNDVSFTLRPSGVQVDITVTDGWIGQPEGRFKLSELKNALIGWRRFLQMPSSLDSVVEIEI